MLNTPTCLRFARLKKQTFTMHIVTYIHHTMYFCLILSSLSFTDNVTLLIPIDLAVKLIF